MEKIWGILISISIFLIVTFLVRQFFNGFYKKENSKKMRKTWVAKTYYWHFIIMISGLFTTLVILFLASVNILTF